MAYQNVNRLARTISSLNQITIPPIPRLPVEVIARFPTLLSYQAEWDKWRDQMTHQLNKNVASAERSPPPTN